MVQTGVLKLPKQLIDQLGGEGALTGDRKSRPSHGAGSRKQLRKAARDQRKTARAGPPPAKRAKIHHVESGTAEPLAAIPPKKVSAGTENPIPPPKSILKRTKKADPKPSKLGGKRSPSPTRPISRAVKDRLAEDDEEIAALEKKLGLKGKKLPQSFKDDGLDELLEGLDAGEDSDSVQRKKAKADGDEWLDRKRKEALAAKKRGPIDDDSPEDEDEGEGDDEEVAFTEDTASDVSFDEQDFSDDISEEETHPAEDLLGSDDGFEGFESEGEVIRDSMAPLKRTRENPYVAPSSGHASTQKYIPPSLRKLASSDSEELVRLRRRTQGLVNRLTESNLISILGDIENLYRGNPRQHVTSTLVDILLTSVCEPTSLPDTLIILPAGFIAAIYKVIGTDFGAQVIQRIVEMFDEHYSRTQCLAQTGPAAATVDSSKETSNLIMLLSEMYNFQVVGSNLIFDYVRLFLEKLTELNAELLLKIIRASGPQLRQDDPSSLKDIVALLRPAIASAGGEENLSVRTKFMIETINDLKNNKMKTGGVASAVASQHTVQMKKIIGSLNTRTIKGSDPLRIGLKDIQESDKKGKWWLVGASWAGNAKEDGEDLPTTQGAAASGQDRGTSDLAQLAKEQRMNTDIRRAIFVTILSATDYQDAYLRLMKLKLKKVQEYEIPKVLVHCAGGEHNYNPYYTLIAKKICGDRRLKMTFQYCLWDLFKQMGESNDDEDEAHEEEEEALDTRHLVNLAKMFGSLIADGSLSLSVLKNLNLSYLQPKTTTFLEVLFITAFLESQKQSGTDRNPQAVAAIISKTNDTPQLHRGLQHFMRKVVSKTDIAGGKEQKETVKWACKVARDTLKALAASDRVGN